ncbi:MAG TPA: signal recognition particle-docking protein FtsY, partial [Acholeplasmataceae bacterium]|nr:signal recognition particle-docking protein FtsY [Acholeplasmataceae bacterium]
MGFFSFFKSKDKKKDAEKYRIGMEKTRKGSFSLLKQLFSRHNQVTEELFDELEEIFVMADIGVETVVKFVDELKRDPRV